MSSKNYRRENCGKLECGKNTCSGQVTVVNVTGKSQQSAQDNAKLEASKLAKKEAKKYEKFKCPSSCNDKQKPKTTTPGATLLGGTIKSGRTYYSHAYATWKVSIECKEKKSSKKSSKSKRLAAQRRVRQRA